MLFRCADLASRLGGELLPTGIDDDEPTVDGVSIDSRDVDAGELFVPLVADRDGHEFVGSAIDGGAAAYLSSRGVVDERSPAICVADTGAALTEIGRIARARIAGSVVGVTGSVGKTSVKDLIAAACGSDRRVHASEKSFNNELGVPLTLANAPDDVETVVLEMGARGIGHIAELCEVGRPTIGVITTVALAHSELFGSIEGVAKAKGELVEALPATGTAVLNADHPLVAAMASRTEASVLTFGVAGGDVRAVDVTLDEVLRPSFALLTPAGSVDVRLEVRGAHMAMNAAAAAAAALAVGVALDDIATGLTAAALSPWRMEVATAANGLVVINDAYNANPTSMRAAIDSLCQLEVGTRIAVVGEMAELGEEGPAEHAAIADEAKAAAVRLIAVGAPAYGSAAEHVADRAEAAALLRSSGVGAGAAVLVKGSRVAQLEALAADLLADG